MELWAFRASVGAGFIASCVMVAQFMGLVHVRMKRLAKLGTFKTQEGALACGGLDEPL